MVVSSELRTHKVMEAAIRELMGAGTPPRFKFKDTYASIEFPEGYTVPAQATLEAKYNELLALEEDIQKTAIEGDLEVGTANIFVDTETGNVGVGGANIKTKLHVTHDGPEYGANITNDRVRIMNRVTTGDAQYIGNEYGVQMGVSGSGNSSIQTIRYINSTDTVEAQYNLLLQPNGGNVGIGMTSPSEKLHVVGNLNLNGSTMSKPPYLIHIDDTRSGCPPSQAANTPIIQYNLVLSRTAYVYVSVTTILNHTTRADCRLYFGPSLVQTHLTATDNTEWNPVNITAGAILSAGTTNIKLTCSVANVVGCGPEWGGMQILVFET